MSPAEGELTYTLEQAARMVPLPSVNALRILLHRRKDLAPPRYLPTRQRGRRRHRQPARLLSLTEIERIRAIYVTTSREK